MLIQIHLEDVLAYSQLELVFIHSVFIHMFMLLRQKI